MPFFTTFYGFHTLVEFEIYFNINLSELWFITFTLDTGIVLSNEYMNGGKMAIFPTYSWVY